MPQQAVHEGPERPVGPEKAEKPGLKIHGRGLAVKVSPDGKRMRVSGKLEIGKSILPFSYDAQVDEPPATHGKKLEDFRQRGEIWAAKRPTYHALVGEKVHDWTVTFAELAAVGPYDWKLRLVVRRGPERKRLEFPYRHPGTAMSAEKLMTRARQMLAPVPKSPTIKQHEEALRGLSNSHKA